MSDLTHAPYLRDAMESFAHEHSTAVIRFVIGLCAYCEGRGTETLRGIDVTAWVREDSDFAEAYAHGDYTDRCSDCQGKGRYFVLSDEDDTADARSYYDEWLAEVWASKRLERLECGVSY